MIRFLKGLLDGEAKSAAAIAKEFLRSRHPDLLVHGTWFRAKEPERFVFAVTYDRPGLPSRPSPYKLVAVDRQSGEASFLETTPDSPYWMHGRK